MIFDYDWLMMMIDKFANQYDRGLITKFEFDRDMDNALIRYWDNMPVEGVSS